MKKMKKLIAVALCLAFVFSMSMMLTACPPEEEEAKPCNFTLDFDATKGSVTLDKDSYEAGDKVIVTVTSLDAYEIKSIKIDSNNVTETVRKGNYDFFEATYEFIASVDRTIRVEFQERGIWQDSNYVWTLNLSGYNTSRGSVVVSPDRSRYANNEEITISISTTSNSIIKVFKINGVDKRAEISNGVYVFEITADTNVEVKLDTDVTVLTNATLANFDSEINREGRVLLDFWADNCAPCTDVVAPQLAQLVSDCAAGVDYAVALDIKVVKVRVSKNYDLSVVNARYDEYQLYTRYKSYHEGGLPFLIIIENGEVIGSLHGAYSKYSDFLEWVQNPYFVPVQR